MTRPKELASRPTGPGTPATAKVILRNAFSTARSPGRVRLEKELKPCWPFRNPASRPRTSARIRTRRSPTVTDSGIIPLGGELALGFQPPQQFLGLLRLAQSAGRCLRHVEILWSQSLFTERLEEIGQHPGI